MLKVLFYIILYDLLIILYSIEKNIYLYRLKLIINEKRLNWLEFFNLNFGR